MTLPHRSLGRLLVAGVAGALLLVGVAAAPAQATLYGVDQNLTVTAQDRATLISRARDSLGAKVSRGMVGWNLIEPSPAQYDWSAPDQVVRDLRAAGIEPLLVLINSPPWANGSTDAGAVPTDPAAFTEWTRSFAAFAAQAARRYKGQVRYWEVWNEQNEAYFWRPGPKDAGRYAELFNATRPAMKREDPAAKIAIGGMAALNSGAHEGVLGKIFVDQLLRLGVQADAVAIHPYATSHRDPDAHDPKLNNFDDTETIRNILVKHDRASTPLWITEWGYSTWAVGGLDRQARFVKRSLERIRDEWSSFVELATYFTDRDIYNPGKKCCDHGLQSRYPDLTLKPSGAEFGRFTRALPVQPEEQLDPDGDGVPGIGPRPRPTETGSGRPGTPGAPSGSGSVGSTGNGKRPTTRTCRIRLVRERIQTVKARGVSCATARTVLRRHRGRRRLPKGWRCKGRVAGRGSCTRGTSRLTWVSRRTSGRR